MRFVRRSGALRRRIAAIAQTRQFVIAAQ